MYLSLTLVVIASEAKQSRGTKGAERLLDRHVAVARRKTGVFRRPIAPRDDDSVRTQSALGPRQIEWRDDLDLGRRGRVAFWQNAMRLHHDATSRAHIGAQVMMQHC